LLREERVESTAAFSVMSVIGRSERRAWKLELIEIIFGLVARLVLGVQLLIVVRLVDVELIWTDSNNGS
jgi:hypothetical protein